MLEALKNKVYNANIELVRQGLVIYTWGNVSAIDRSSGLVVIKPSGVSYELMKPEDMVVVNLEGRVVEGKLKPSSDTPTHLELYKAFKSIGGVTHTHSKYATALAQTGRGLPAYGTTHADYFYGAVPCTRELSPIEVSSDYEKNTGLVIAEAFADIDPDAVPACLVKSHGPFTWGRDCDEAVYHAAVLEYCSEMALITESLGCKDAAPKYLLDKHYLRKHGKNAYYGQGNH
jgi:L-ribulose-5-phosphate 4-epimerase